MGLLDGGRKPLIDQHNYRCGMGDEQSILYIFEPRSHGQTLTRSMEFKFTEETAEALSVNGNYRTNAKTLVGNDRLKEAMRTSIIPQQQPDEVDTSIYDDRFSFVLIYRHRVSDNSFRGRGLVVTELMQGYFMEDPVFEEYGKTHYDFNTIMQFTHTTTVNIKEVAGARGGRKEFGVTQNSDLVGEHIAPLREDRAMLCDISSIAKSNPYNDRESQWEEALGEITLANMHENSERVDVTSRIPLLQLGKVAAAADASIDPEFDSMNNRIMQNGGVSRMEACIANIQRNIYTHTGGLNFSNGAVEPASIMTFGELDEAINNLHIQEVEGVEPVPEDIGDKEIISIDNTMASLVANAIPAYAVDFMIADIVFAYRNYNTGLLGSVGNRGVWEIQNYGPLCDDVSDTVMESNLRKFQQMLEDQIWPILDDFGDYTILVDFNSSGSTIVDLIYEDESVDCGIFASHNTLGGIAAPAIGGEQSYHSNTENQMALVQTMAAIGEGLSSTI